ncbi:carboxylating nicotinate-nucleotide diphosphorylase [Macrococcoides caseolyticum]|uniref:carboxylating nicotinate-nucleotide diphosphorylase n=1 Tax=Macrococcoides caseolyticum TaxID=69966 RepID=UPI001F3EC40F|nr:carboxylating nicotinate-nucleotide diphosphorylase [Macrococcus caseolyticus]MCE4957303.1 carboxylating nicotinate-nucleotide diphosphorylase [Macrococcus caseolyticus]
MNLIRLEQKLRDFMDEDLSYGDLSSAIFDNDTTGTMRLIAKEDGYFSGEDVILRGFNILDKCDVVCFKHDGDTLHKGEVIAEISGKVKYLLQAERTVLNIIQRMSGITTETKRYMEEIAHTSAQVTDTRKTTPGLGMFEKYAVRVAGASNHRRNLNDGIMLKDNHIAFMGSIESAVQSAKALHGHMDKIEVEIEDEVMLEEAISAQADIIMFDNCTPEFIKAHIHLVPAHIITEASGGINIDTIKAYGETGVDYISVGKLFHGANALDISGKVDIND